MTGGVHSSLLGPRFREALTYASELHECQPRKGTEIPYLAHLLSVAALVLEDGGDEDEAIAALLHDAVEDQGGKPTLDAIRSRFGERVAHIVEACSDTDTWPKPPWRERKERYIEYLEAACPGVLRVSLADKLHNARAIVLDYRQMGDPLWSKFNAPRVLLAVATKCCTGSGLASYRYWTTSSWAITCTHSTRLNSGRNPRARRLRHPLLSSYWKHFEPILWRSSINSSLSRPSSLNTATD